MRLKIWLLLLIGASVSAMDMSEDEDAPLDDNIAEESIGQEEFLPAYALPKSIFNDGKPFIVGKDPITGAIDFNTKKTVGTGNEIKDPIKDQTSTINQIAPNIHDFLNLPVKYSSSKSVYPLISSSYANLKYQGNNKLFDSNHKNFSTTTTTSPKYYTDKPAFKPLSNKISTGGLPVTANQAAKTTIFAVKSTEAPSTTAKPTATTAKYTLKQKYQDIAATRKKFLPTTTTAMPKTEKGIVRFEDQPTTTRRPISVSTVTTTSVKISSPSIRPFTSRPYSPIIRASSATTSTSTTLPPKKKESSMSFADIFSAFANFEESKEENALYDSGFEASKIVATKPVPSASTVNLTTKLPQTSTQRTTLSTPRPTVAPSRTTLSTQRPTISTTTRRSEVVQFIGRPQQQQDSEISIPAFGLEAPKPTLNENSNNMVQFGVMPVKNTFVISPGQNSASFVLGSQQGGGGFNQPPASGGHFVGTALKEDVFSSRPEENKFPGKVINDVVDSETVPQGFKIKVQGNQQGVRFPPAAASQVNQKFENPQVVVGSFNQFPDKNLTPSQMNSELSEAIEEGFNQIFSSETKKNETQPQQSTPASAVVIFKEPQLHQQMIPPQQNQAPLSLFPEQDQKPPQPSPQHQNIPHAPLFYGDFQRRPVAQRPHPYPAQLQGSHIPGPHIQGLHTQVPHPQHPQGPPHQPQSPGFRLPNSNPNRVQFAPDRLLMIERPEGSQPVVFDKNAIADRPLPNILPQFRPNSKPKKDNGPIRFKEGIRQPVRPEQYPLQGRPPVRSRPPPSFAMRRSPPPPPHNRYMTRNPAEEFPGDQNRRHFRVPVQPLMDRMYVQQMPPAQYGPHHGSPHSPPHSQPPRRWLEQGMQQILMQRHQNFPPHAEPEARIPIINHPPLKPLPWGSVIEKHSLVRDEPLKIDLTSKREIPPLNPAPVVESVLEEGNQPIQPVKIETASDKKNVYVVYPTKGDLDYLSDEKEPVRLTPGAEYQNTPFSVVPHFDQEPILMAKEKPKKNSFPYAMERPDPITAMESAYKSEPHHIRKGQLQDYGIDTVYNIGEEPVVGGVPPKISSTLPRVTSERPIAIAYTPTEPTFRPEFLMNHHYPRPIYPTEDANSNDFPPRIKENFQAPFHASINLPTQANTIHEGSSWAIVTPSYESNNIDRSDNHVESNFDRNPEKFDLDKFQPELIGGFRPIYSPEAKTTRLEPTKEFKKANNSAISTSTSTTVTLNEKSVTSSQSTTTMTVAPSTTTTTTSRSEVERKSTTRRPIDSLEAFFDSLTRDYDEDDDETAAGITTTSTTSRST